MKVKVEVEDKRQLEGKLYWKKKAETCPAYNERVIGLGDQISVAEQPTGAVVEGSDLKDTALK